eukprot:8979406-Ditylum_brightwellii.AAC.1
MVMVKKKLLGILEEDSAPNIKLVDDAIVVCGFGVACQSVFGMLQKAGANRKGGIVEQHYLRILTYMLEQMIDRNNGTC